MIEGNFIGTDPTGTIARGNGLDGILVTGSANQIGSASPSDRNVLSANQTGVQIVDPAQENAIQGNYIGIDATGLHPLGNNSHEGIGLEFDLSSGNGAAGNVISGNANYGIFNFFSTNNNFTGNLIGTDATGMVALGNGLDGVLINESPVTTVQSNLISGNGRAGVDLMSGNTANTSVDGNDIGTDAAGIPSWATRASGSMSGRRGTRLAGP